MIVLLVSVILVISAISVALSLRTPPQQIIFPLTAGIIDPLAEEMPNPSFVKNVTTTLETHGFNVTYKNGTLGVNFFENLAKYNYGIIILRAHSALREDNSTVDLFTSEPYDPSAHVEEQENELLVQGVLNYTTNARYFAMTYKFIENLQGTFPKSIIIAMGCNTLAPGRNQIAEAFNKKGASVFIGWNFLVGNTVTDSETQNLVSKLAVNNETVGEAIYDVWDTFFGAQMECYPQKAQDLTISDLTANASRASSSQSMLLDPSQRRYTTGHVTMKLALSDLSLTATLTTVDFQWKQENQTDLFENTTPGGLVRYLNRLETTR